jgi:UDP-N-acetylmuramate--alanine ligase
MYANKRIILLYEPHQHDRTEKFFDEFVSSLSHADMIIVSEIYGVTGRTDSNTVSSKDIVEKMKSNYPNKEIYYSMDLEKSEQIIREKADSNDIILIQGAGDIDKVARRLVEN